MKTSVLITGANGSGKSEVGRKLKALGYETYDIDSLLDLCVMVDKESGLPTPYDNGNDIEKMERMYWFYKVDDLRNFIATQKNDVAFYCGNPNNLREILPLFDTVILLIASPENIRHRLTSRTDNGFGKSPEVQEYILRRKEKMEKEVQESGGLVIDADQGIDAVVEEVINKSH